MELKLLEDLICLSETRSFSRSADMRHVSQSTLSKRIRLLEDWVGATLIDRSSYPIELTAKGRKVIEQAREAAALMAAMRQAPCPPRRAGGISIVGMHTLLQRMVPVWRSEIDRRGIRSSIERIHQNNCYADNVDVFRNGQADLFVTYLHESVHLDLEVAGLDLMPLGRERIIAVSAPDAAGRALHDPATGMFNYIGYTAGSFFHTVMEDRLAAIPARVEVGSNSMCIGLRSMALMGVGAAWLPERMVARDLEGGTLVRSGDAPDVVVETALMRHRRRTSAAADALWSLSKDVFAPRHAAMAC